MDKMEGFVSRRNIDRYRQLLDVTTDEAQRKTLTDLLAEEQARQEVASPKKDHRA